MLTAIGANEGAGDVEIGHRSGQIIGEPIARITFFDYDPQAFESRDAAGRRTWEECSTTLARTTELLCMHAKLLSDGLGQGPSLATQDQETSFLQLLLRGPNRVFPLLAIAFAIDDPVNTVVAQVRMDRLDLRMELLS